MVLEFRIGVSVGLVTSHLPIGKWWHYPVQCGDIISNLGPVSISDKTTCFKISWSLEAARFVFRIVRSLWNLAGTSVALLPKCVSNFKAMRKFKLRISRFRAFTRSCDKTSYWILKRGPGCEEAVIFLFFAHVHHQHVSLLFQIIIISVSSWR